jgi:hypothetical protein
MSMIYQWRADSRFPIGATIAAERLSQIKKQNGEITPRAVVDDAASPKSPLHPCFEWDDSKAADAHRLSQARKLIGSIVVAEVNDKPVKYETRAFVHITADSPRYEPIQVAMRTEFMREEVIDRAWKEIAMWRTRYNAYVEFSEIIDAIDISRRKRSA